MKVQIDFEAVYRNHAGIGAYLLRSHPETLEEGVKVWNSHVNNGKVLDLLAQGLQPVAPSAEAEEIPEAEDASLEAPECEVKTEAEVDSE